MLGKVDGETMIIMDSFALPVEGTETRVNAQAAAYEYMAAYIENAKQVRHSFRKGHLTAYMMERGETKPYIHTAKRYSILMYSASLSADGSALQPFFLFCDLFIFHLAVVENLL